MTMLGLHRADFRALMELTPFTCSGTYYTVDWEVGACVRTFTLD